MCRNSSRAKSNLKIICLKTSRRLNNWLLAFENIFVPAYYEEISLSVI